MVQSLVWSESNRRSEGKGRVFAEVVVRRGMADFDSAVLHRVYNGKTRNDFTGSKYLNLKFVISGFSDRLAHDVGATEDCIKRFRPAHRHAPFDFRQ